MGAMGTDAGEAAGAGQAGACLNCGTALVGAHCHACGQPAHVHRTAGALWHDIAHSVFHFEGKIWRTLPMLAWHPGALTRRYIAGERARFLSPLAAFLFSAGAPPIKGDVDAAIEPVVDMDLSNAPGPLPWIDNAWRRAKADKSLLAYKLSSNSYKYSWALIPISVPLVWLLFLNRARYRREYRLYDHAVFVTYSIAFMSLFAVGYTFLKLLGLIGPAAVLPFLIAPIHMYRQLRGAYLLPRLSALWRAAMLVVFALVAGILFFMLLLLAGLLG
jgi:hypothetical protein